MERDTAPSRPTQQPMPARAAPAAAPSPAPAARSATPLARPQALFSDAALAVRQSPRHEPTIVHVTIDRLDVRAASAPPPAPAPRSRQRPEPSISLSDYLGGGSGGGRR